MKKQTESPSKLNTALSVLTAIGILTGGIGALVGGIGAYEASKLGIPTGGQADKPIQAKTECSSNPPKL